MAKTLCKNIFCKILKLRWNLRYHDIASEKDLNKNSWMKENESLCVSLTFLYKAIFNALALCRCHFYINQECPCIFNYQSQIYFYPNLKLQINSQSPGIRLLGSADMKLTIGKYKHRYLIIYTLPINLFLRQVKFLTLPRPPVYYIAASPSII